MKSSKDILIELARERTESEAHSWGAAGLVQRPANEVLRQVPTDIHVGKEVFADAVKTEDELVGRLGGRKWRDKLRKLGWFTMLYYGATENPLRHKPADDHDMPILPMPCTGARLVRTFGSKGAVHNMLKLCMRIGLVARVTHTYRFGCRDSDQNYGYLYAYNRDVAALIRKACRKHRLEPRPPQIAAHSSEYRCVWDRIDREAYGEADDDEQGIDVAITGGPEGRNISAADAERITLRTRRVGVRGVSDAEVERIIKLRYAELIAPRSLYIDEMNREFLPVDERIKFEMNVKRDRRDFIKRIGWRAASSIVSLKEHANGNPNYTGRWRKEYLDSEYGKDGYFEFDVRASIYQISHLLNFGEWIGNRRDPYEIMFGRRFASREEREAYKSICMALYFDHPNLILSHNLPKLQGCVDKYGKNRLKEVFAAEAKAMEAFTGEKFHNEIFLHESLLYVDFVYWLRKERGVPVTQIYDGFYVEKGGIDEEELECELERCARKYLADYRQWRRLTSGRCDLMGK